MVGCLLGAAAGLLHFVNFAFDDAFISFRYAENLVEGRGLVFNPGERVEGFSNPLWTLLLTLPVLLGADRFELGLLACAKLMGACATLVTVVVVARTTALLAPELRPSRNSSSLMFGGAGLFDGSLIAAICAFR
jgi:hypothetical protein